MENNQKFDIKEVKGEALPALTDQQRKWKGTIVNRQDKKSGAGRDFWLYSDLPDDRGLNQVFAVFSTTDKAIIDYYLKAATEFEMVYDKNAKYGSFNIDHIGLPDGTWATKEAKNAWKKGNKANNRALALNSAAILQAGKKESDDQTVIDIAEVFIAWIEKE